MSQRRALSLATVSRSLALQSPEAWQVLREHGYAVTFAAARDTWTETLLARNPGSSFVEVRAERRLGASLLGLARQLHALSRQDWDVVQVQSPIIAALWRIVAARAARRRTVYVVHGFHFQPGDRGLRSLAARLVEGALAHRTRGLATVSAADADFVRSLPRVLRPEVVVPLPGAGVPVDSLATRGGGPPDGAPSAPYALFVGDLNANKDPMSAVAAVEECRRRGQAFDLVVIGEGPLEAEVTAAARARPWLHHVSRTDEVSRWLAGAEVLLAPSRREGVPRVIIEALATGTPVVARHNRGSAELLADGVGEIVNTADEQDWAKAILSILAAPRDTAAMFRRAQRYDTAAFRAAYGKLLVMMGARQHADLERLPHEARRVRTTMGRRIAGNA